ncbi:transmembrane protein 143-like isoform X2 [Ruditapes philippinarum]|uniref:transmembrane protein 143-like isoform X2 n=1 Tax=Ruditapes philippinarum TaxID=129788 RepID=UPI00295ACCB2|nr:transmembrane protein 143-like isoform X2 [Ruditapes philippinarum]
MAALIRKAGEIQQKTLQFTKQKILPTSKMVVSRVGPPIVKSSKYVAKKMGPPLKKTSRYLVSAARPYAERASNAVVMKATPHIEKAQASLSTLVQSKDRESLLPEEEDNYRERFIQVTRKSIIRHLMQKKDFLTQEELKVYEDFALALDTAIVNKYHGVLQELKNLFDPLNPDKDTIETRKWNPRERQENEFWLLQRLDDLMQKANFHELPDEIVNKALEEHVVSDGVRVSVDRNKYDVMKFWALGREKIPVSVPWYKALFIKKEDMPKPKLYYKRVVIALRFKRDQKLMLKSFKEIPVNALEMMLPDGKIEISKFDKGIIATSMTFAVTGIVAKLVTVLAAMNVDWMLVMSGVTGLMAAQSWTLYKNKRNKYLVDLSRLLYFKNVANNRGLLALLVDRAEDESFKEALLVYTFLLANRPDTMYSKRSIEMSPHELGGLTAIQLEGRIEKWVYEVTGTKIEFESLEAVNLLRNFGILSDIDDRLYVLPLRAAVNNLPQQPQSVVARATESDIYEGYDRDTFIETEEQYQEEEKVQKRIGWF